MPLQLVLPPVSPFLTPRMLFVAICLASSSVGLVSETLRVPTSPRSYVRLVAMPMPRPPGPLAPTVYDFGSSDSRALPMSQVGVQTLRRSSLQASVATQVPSFMGVIQLERLRTLSGAKELFNLLLDNPADDDAVSEQLAEQVGTSRFTRGALAVYGLDDGCGRRPGLAWGTCKLSVLP